MELQDLLDQQDEDRRESRGSRQWSRDKMRKKCRKMEKTGLQCHQDPRGQAMGHLDPAPGSFGHRC
jgi:hypothetical protein